MVFFSLPCEDTKRDTIHVSQEGCPHQNPTTYRDLGLLASKLWEINVYWLSHQVYDILF